MKECITHHNACDCREEKIKRTIEVLEDIAALGCSDRQSTIDKLYRIRKRSLEAELLVYIEASKAILKEWEE